MADDNPRPVGRVVRDPAFRNEVLGRENREGELEVVAERTDDWVTGARTITPSPAKAQQVQSALKEALKAQLATEAASIGGDADLLAIHGRTGVSNLEALE